MSVIPIRIVGWTSFGGYPVSWKVLCDCLPSSVRRTLGELPESLDEACERILKEMMEPDRDLTRRVLWCLVVVTRPRRVAELAVDFDAEGIPRTSTSNCMLESDCYCRSW